MENQASACEYHGILMNSRNSFVVSGDASSCSMSVSAGLSAANQVSRREHTLFQ